MSAIDETGLELPILGDHPAPPASGQRLYALWDGLYSISSGGAIIKVSQEHRVPLTIPRETMQLVSGDSASVTHVNSTSYAGNCATYILSDALNDEWSVPVVLQKGTYLFVVLWHGNTSTGGIETYYLDATQIGEVDQSSTASLNQLYRELIEVTETAEYTFSAKITASGATSGDHRSIVTLQTFTPVPDNYKDNGYADFT